MTFIGQPILRNEDKRLLTGGGTYSDDVTRPGMLHAAILRSSHAHGIIRGIDASEARALPGVVAVYSWADIAETAQPIPIRLAPLVGLDRFPQYSLASDKVRFVGEPIAVVVAESRYIAEDALNLIAVDMEELPAIVDWEGAAQPKSLLHEAHGTNVASSYQVQRGDVEAAFAEADYRRRETFVCQRHTGVPMETRAVIAEWDVAAQHMTVWGATKVPFPNRATLAKMLGLPNTAVDLIEVDVGGGFGIRGEFYPEDFLIPFAALKLGRPVKWIEDRREHLLSAQHSRDVSCVLEIACKRDGTILGLKAELFVDLGAYVRTVGGVVPAKAAQFVPGPYRIANVGVSVNVFLSNKTPVGTYRAPGRYESNFFRERLVDMAAADLGIDPAEIRRKNLVPESAMPYGIGKLVPYEPEGEYDTGDFLATFERALADSDWKRLNTRQGEDENGWLHGTGIACFVETGGAGPAETARLVVRKEDGGIDLSIGSSALGQGHETVFAQICADALGIPFEGIRVFHGSTTLLDEGFGTYASRAIVMGGSAVLVTAEKLIETMRPLAAEALGLPNEALVWKNGRFETESGGASIDLATLAAAAPQEIRADGIFSSMRRTTSYGTHVAHVAVDKRTGQVRLIDYYVVEDVGRIVNPLIVHGQAVGGVVQGLGGAFLENLAYDANGQFLAGSFADYLMPTATDFPSIHCNSLELSRAPSNPLGAKGAGEGGTTAAGAAIGNAVSAALRKLGAEVHALPLTPSNVWSLIARAKN